jgi:hypothetical protein
MRYARLREGGETPPPIIPDFPDFLVLSDCQLRITDFWVADILASGNACQAVAMLRYVSIATGDEQIRRYSQSSGPALPYSGAEQLWLTPALLISVAIRVIGHKDTRNYITIVNATVGVASVTTICRNRQGEMFSAPRGLKIL